MDIIISNSGGKPIYEQIASQVKSLILSGKMQEREALPSIRLLAKELRISVITTKRAYEDLERDGFIETVPGKGSFVAPKDVELVREEHMRQIEISLQQAIDWAKTGGISADELKEFIDILFQNEA
ncbi:MAG: GntR family transcriptional regulator [Oscillospiraceae bacterium]